MQGNNLEDHDVQSCIEILKLSSWFMFCSDESLRTVAKRMNKEKFSSGEVIIHKGQPHKKMYVIASGKVDRLRSVDGRQHLMEKGGFGSTIGAYYIINQDPSYSDAVCKSDVICYSISNEELMPLFENPVFGREIAYNLNLEIRRHLLVGAELGRTPLLEQKGRSIPYLAITVAASIESFYRAAMNAFINAAVTGQKTIQKGALFPNMHLQIPTRVAYINGFKGLRQAVDDSSFVKNANGNTMIRLAAAITPGVCMTPISSLLEAYSAGHMNPEPLAHRWKRGIVPRCAREVIFGVGLNQLSDYCEERVGGFISNPVLRTAGASIVAGVIAGYFSHVPHNLSTLKLLNPTKSYPELIRDYIKASESRLPEGIFGLGPSFRTMLSYPISVLFPRGCLIRTTQIIGSFIILNGTINWLQSGKLNKVFGTSGLDSSNSGGGIDTSKLFMDPRAELMRRVRIERTQAGQGRSKNPEDN